MRLKPLENPIDPSNCLSRVGASAATSVAFAVFYLALALSSTAPAKANDSTWPCASPPVKGASVSVHPGTTVTITQDTQRQTCSFGINGAVSTSPPSEQVVNALNLFRDPSRRVLQDRNTTLSAVAALMAATAPVDEIPADLLKALDSAGAQLQSCVAIFFAKGDLPDERSQNGAFICRGIRPYFDAKSKAQMLASTGAAAAVPTLMISVKWRNDRFTTALYLPRDMVGVPPIRTP